MKRMVSIVVGSAALMCGAARVETATFEEIASDAQVVTAVDLSGLASEAAVAGAADAGTNYVDAATNAVMTSVEGKGYLTSESDPTTGVTNDVPYVRGKQVLTSESDPVWRAWTNGTSVALGRNAVYSSTNRMIVIGMDASASNMDTVVIGRASVASGDGATVVGANCKATAYSATAIDGTASGDHSTAIKGTASGDYSTAIDGTASGYASVAVGLAAKASESSSTAIRGTASGVCATAVGLTAAASGRASTAVGNSSAASGRSSTAVGRGSYARGDNSTALGYMAYAPANSLGLAYTPDTILLCSSNTTEGAGSTARSLRSYLRYTRKTLDAASFTAEDGVIYSLTLDDTMAASGIDVTLPESKDWVQDFILRLENPTTSATQFGDLGAAAIDYPNGKLTETGAIEAGTTNYFTFTETGAGRWMITSLPANK